jgi:hypothetical protein
MFRQCCALLKNPDTSIGVSSLGTVFAGRVESSAVAMRVAKHTTAKARYESERSLMWLWKQD